MNEIDAMNYMDKVIEMVVEGVKKDDLEDDKREEARIENLEYRDECRKEHEDDYWEPNEL